MNLEAMLFFWGNVRAQDRTLTGSILSVEDGSPLPGVNVLVKGTPMVLRVMPKAFTDSTLTFSFIGLTSKEVELGNQNVVDVRLSADVKQLNEVVVTAGGIQRQSKSLGYSVSKVRRTDSGESVKRRYRTFGQSSGFADQHCYITG